MKKMLLLLTLAASHWASAQNAPVAPAGRWQLGLVASPDYSYRSLSAASGNSSAQTLKTERDNTEHGRMAFTAGLAARRYFTTHFGLSLGLQFAQRQFSRKTNNSAWEDQFDPNTGTTLPGQNIQLFAWDEINYLELPIGLLYRSSADKKVAFVANAGLSVNCLLGARYYYVRTTTSEVSRGNYKLDDLNKLNLSAFASAGAEWKVGTKLSLSLAPVFRYGLNSVTDAPLKGRLWAAGLQVGAMLRL